MSSASWEGWDPTWAQPGRAGHGGDDDADEDVDYNNVSPEFAAEQFGDMLVDLKLMNSLSARQTCVLAFRASKAGAKGIVGQLGMRPDQ